MTNNTINNVPRELLERAVRIPTKASVEENHAAIVDRGRAQSELRALLSAPSPAGGGGLRGDAAALAGRHTLATVVLNYDSTETGLCRVYYRHLRDLFAYQMTQRGQFALFLCTRDGEPIHEVDYKQVDQLPRNYPEFVLWATDNNLVA